MAQTLSQDEVDALLKGVDGGEVQTESSSPSQGAKQSSKTIPSADGVQLYDFTRSEVSITGRLPGLEIVFHKFTRRLRNIFTSELGKSVDVGFDSVEVILYEDLIKGIPLPSSIHLVRLEPLRGHGVFMIEAPLAYTMVDLFFGGTGQRIMKVEGRDFTPLETNFLGKFVGKMLSGMEESWQTVIQLEGRYVRSEVNPYLLGASAMGDSMIVTRYKIDMTQVAGEILFAFPLLAVEEVRDRLKSPFTAPEGDNEDLRNRLRTHVLNSELSVQVVLDVIDISLQEILKLSPGDFIQLDSKANERAELWVGERVLYRGKTAQNNETKVFVVSERVED